jgi:hypothetical protein
MGTTSPNAPQPSYVGMGLDLFDTIGNAIFLLEQNDDGSAAMAGRIADLQDRQTKVKADLIAYAAGKIQINPPTNNQIATVLTQTKALDDAVNNANIATDFLTLVTAAMTSWQSIKQ